MRIWPVRRPHAKRDGEDGDCSEARLGRENPAPGRQRTQGTHIIHKTALRLHGAGLFLLGCLN